MYRQESNDNYFLMDPITSNQSKSKQVKYFSSTHCGVGDTIESSGEKTLEKVSAKVKKNGYDSFKIVSTSSTKADQFQMCVTVFVEACKNSQAR